MKVKNNIIKAKMTEKGISPSEIAELLGCSRQNIYNMLTKKDVPIFIERLVLICKALDINMMDVFEIEEGDSNAD